jgi:putative transcriptional regulator
LPTEKELSGGRFLVAGREMRDPRFSETVLFLVEYSKRGAVGLIINRPTEVKLSSVWPDMEGLKDRKDTFYIGGPVNISQMLLLIQSSRQTEDSHKVFRDVYASTSMSTLRQLTERPASGERFRVYAGYAGWTAGQLEREISRGDWHVMDADVQMIFDRDPSDIWQELIRRTSADWV